MPLSPDDVEADRVRVQHMLAGTRDRLAHAYFDVNFEIIWQIIQADFPRLLPALDRLLQKISGDLR